jgi:hypothetical protein
VDFVDRDVLRSDQRRFDQTIPAGRLPVGIVEIEYLAAGAVHGQAGRVGVGDDVGLDLAGSGGKHINLEQIILPVPIRPAGDRPDTAVGVQVMV